MRIYEKFEKEYEEALDWIIDVVAENANPAKVEENIDLYVNDYVRSAYEYMTKEEQTELINEVVKQYKLL